MMACDTARQLRLAVVSTYLLTAAASLLVRPPSTLILPSTDANPWFIRLAGNAGMRVKGCRGLGLGASARVQAGERHDADYAPGEQFERGAWF